MVARILSTPNEGFRVVRSLWLRLSELGDMGDCQDYGPFLGPLD